MVVADTVYFDIGKTLGVVTGAPAVLTAYGFVPAVLDELRALGIRLGIISNTGNLSATDVDSLIAGAGIGAVFEAELRLYSSVEGITKESLEMFRRAIDRAGTPPVCVFVGEDVGERSRAVQAGMRTAPHPLLAADVARGDDLHYVKVNGLGAAGVVPLQVSSPTDALAIASTSGIGRLKAAGIRVEQLAGDPAVTDLYLVRDDRSHDAAGFATATWDEALGEPLDGRQSGTTSDGVLLALGPDDDIEAYHVANARHGHNLLLLPDPSLRPSAAWATAALSAAFARPWTAAELAALDRITPALIAELIGALASAGPDIPGFVSRHVRHADNVHAVTWIEERLRALGGELDVRRHAFTYQGTTLHNVEAELRGTSDELVLITAHLDSTAQSEGAAYDPRIDPAPGADDDASGVAAVLAIAHAILGLPAAERPQRTLRFVLFNAEEQGLVGSQMYARDHAALGASIAAVFQMDMVGHRTVADEPTRPCEVHVGAADPDVEERSLALATTLADAIAQGLGRSVTSLQVYRSPDPAAGRSDHASFHARGYAACVVSEDFFVGPSTDAPSPQANPSYHRASDTKAIAGYAADIARIVAAAALRVARP